VLCGDALIDLDLTEALKRHREKGAIASLVTKRVPKDQVSSYGVVVTMTKVEFPHSKKSQVSMKP
jgi:mannose-1-phosphate guanylyltransferase